MNRSIEPKDHAEEVALFRAQVLGPVLRRELARGELLAELRVLSTLKFRPPGSPHTRSYAVPTLLRWRRAYLKDGLAGLRPQSRRQGNALTLTDSQRDLLLEIRREHPGVPASVILDTLTSDGRLTKGEVSVQTLRRLYRRHGLSRTSKARANRPAGERRRWEASAVGELWHADVCHGRAITVDGKTVRVRVHALLDDKSRYIIALRVFGHEREAGMLELWVEAVRMHGIPRTLYLDNGATYRGCALETACGRLGTQLVHASPYDPQARGKMERFWRTMREGCLDHMGAQPSLHAVQARLTAFVVERYHKAAHAGLVGRSPAQVWSERELTQRSTEEIAEALTVRETRRVRGDCTLSIGNVDWELAEAFLVGRLVTVARTFARPQDHPWVEVDERRYKLKPVDPVANGKHTKKRKPKPGIDAVDFDPAGVLLDRMLRRKPRYRGGQ